MNIPQFFQQNPKVAVAFSGGVDSAYLLCLAAQNAEQVHAYYVQSQFQPDFELDDAQAIAAQLGVALTVLRLSVLDHEIVTKNPKNRCYHCKNLIFSAILSAAKADGFTTVLDGSNLDDDPTDRPGMAALAELSVLSPLRLCGLSKAQVRQGAKTAGLAVWNKPAYACLATRVPTGREITEDLLQKVAFSEDFLWQQGFSDLRVRLTDKGCNIQVPAPQMATLIAKRDQIIEKLCPIFQQITLDLGGR